MSQAQITDVATVHVDKARDRRARAFMRDIRRATPMESYKGLTYEGQLLFEETRRRQRIVQELVVEYLMDRDTEGARRVKEALHRNKLFQQGFRSGTVDSTDPLNLWGKPLTKKEQKAADEAERLASGRRKHIIPDPENPRLNVMVDTVRASHLNLTESKKRGAADPEDKLRQSAADRFRRDFDLATFHGSRGFALQDKVDGGGGGSPSHTIALEAQARLNEAKRRLGERHFEILLARIGYEASAEDMHKHGGPDHRSSNIELKVALNALAGVYDHVTIIDRTWSAARRVLGAAGFLK
ncbi:hypothetical protein AB7M45_007843 [Bradyrhizobium elkanii]|uniref:DUF6456 domain-containing protein n=1 Tax=Bradyrhizobium elkanii TaxID=29448 RepID=UPI000917DFB0|nr:DUF6456 domain-containing protein [Bradyrhizobium elkanii]MCW2195070.1 hypothetical protein [Bradyrhizobium elkanii]NWL67238.1 hypothetical protein [Bradyrhizobium elkanii]OIM94096.1 hypothetical protein BLN97_12545 [Bradyrhizobium elkanii]